MRDFYQQTLRRLLGLAGAAVMTLGLAQPALAASPTLELVSPVALVMDADSRQVIYQNNMDQTMYPASITKIMTALLTVENAALDETVTMSYEATHSIDPASSHIALDTDEQLPVEHALYAMMLPSANDAANGLAEHVGGSVETFVEMMNDRAEELGALDTHFVNPHGLHDTNHYTTAHDIALIACQAAENEDFCRIWSTMKYDMPPTNKNVLRNLWSQVRMLNTDGSYYYENCTGGKLGWTPEAKNTCVLMAQQGDIRLVCVLMGASEVRDMFEDAQYLFDYSFQHLSRHQMTSTALENQFVTLTNSTGEETGRMIYGYDLSVLLDDRVDPKDIMVEWNLPADPEFGSAEGASVTLTLEDGGSADQYLELGTFAAQVVSATEGRTPMELPEEEEKSSVNWAAVGKTALKVVLIAVGVLVGGFVLLYLVVRIRYEVRRRKRRKQRRAMAARGKNKPAGTTPPARTGAKKR